MQESIESSRLARLRNWISLAGFIVILGGLFAFFLLFIVDLIQPRSNPYVGILTYMIAPAFMVLGAGLVVLGGLLRHRQLKAAREDVRLMIDLNRARDLRILAAFAGGLVLFLFLSAVGSYQGYHVVASTTFCGQACHSIVEPEYVTHQHSAHAHVACVECHVGPGITSFVKSKLSGAYHAFTTLLDTYPRPIPTPIQNLRPARETCEQCHWPTKFVGNRMKTRTHYLTDAANSEYTVNLLLKVGGQRSKAHGIHWHVANKVEYLATDPRRQVIPWVRVTDDEGKVSEFRARGFTNEVAEHAVRVMDCLDCHNRPAHAYRTPNDAVDAAISRGRIDRSLAFIRSNATALLVQPYATREEAEQKIATGLHGLYTGDPRLSAAIQAVQEIYRDNFFPQMKAKWSAYPENIGHKDWPGCTRCHDDEHRSTDGQKVIGFKDCNACHLILAQGSGGALTQLTPEGQPFQHPEEGYELGDKCHNCHTGGP